MRQVTVRDSFLCGLIVAAVAALSLQTLQAAPPQTPSNPDATRADFDRLMKELSNWGRWGKDDEVGAVNLITPERRRAALRVVKDGITVSLARTAEVVSAIDNPRPVIRVMNPRNINPSNPRPDISGASDTLAVSYHGLVHTHMDAFCHRACKGLMYNGMPMTSVREAGCEKGSIFPWKQGIVTRGILVDVPRLKGVEYLEPGTRIYPEDLDAWVKKTGIKVQAGVRPSGIEGISEPIHALSLIAMGMPIFDSLDLEAVAREAARQNRWEFLLMAAPAAIPGATGSIFNPIAVF